MCRGMCGNVPRDVSPNTILLQTGCIYTRNIVGSNQTPSSTVARASGGAPKRGREGAVLDKQWVFMRSLTATRHALCPCIMTLPDCDGHVIAPAGRAHDAIRNCDASKSPKGILSTARRFRWQRQPDSVPVRRRLLCGMQLRSLSTSLRNSATKLSRLMAIGGAPFCRRFYRHRRRAREQTCSETTHLIVVETRSLLKIRQSVKQQVLACSAPGGSDMSHCTGRRPDRR